MIRRGLVVLGLWLVLFAPACKKADQAPTSAPAEAAPEPQSAAPPPAAEPETPEERSEGEPPSLGAPRDKTRDDGLDRPKGGLLQEPTTIAEAQAELDRAERDLKTLLGPASGTGATPLASGDARCPSACKAFASLERAANAVCRLAGETDSRCTRAKVLVKENKARVSVCQCA